MNLLKNIKKHQSLVLEFFYKLFDMHEGEERRATLMWLYIFSIISGLMIVKPMVNALFLSSFGAERLPQVFILVAVCAAAVSIVYSNMLKTTNLQQLINRTLYIIIYLFAIFWLLLTFNWIEAWVLYLLYIIVAIFAVISSSQFWIMANIIFNAREAKRLFGFIGSGAIAGGIFGGYLTNFLAPIIRSENLIIVFLAILGGCLVILNNLWRENKNTKSLNQEIQNSLNTKIVSKKPWQLIQASRHLSLIAALVGIGVLVGKLVEYQYSAVALSKIHDPDELTAFFGFWFSNFNIATIIIQLFLTQRVVGVFGVGTSLFFQPFTILFGAIAILFFPELWAAVLIKLFDASLKNSINKSGMELLALPIAIDVRTQSKSFIDVFIDSFATGISGLMLVALTGLLNATVQQVSFLIILIIAFWIYFVTLVRREYIKSFRLKIETVSDPEERIDFSNESVISGMIKVLIEGSEKQIMQVLRMIRPIQNDRFQPAFKKLILNESNIIRLEVIRQLYFYRNLDLKEDVKQLITDDDLDVRTEALHYLYQKTGENRNELLLEFLDNKDYMIRSASLICTSRECRDNLTLREYLNIIHRIENELLRIKDIVNEDEVITIKRSAARSIGEARLKPLYPFLQYLLRDPEITVVRAAIIGAGLSKDKELGTLLIELLKDKKYWLFSQTALISFGSDIISLLASHLKNPYVDRQAKSNIPKVLAGIEIQASVNALFQNLDVNDREVRNEIIQALFQLRNKAPHLHFSEPDIIKLLFEEANDYLNTLSFLYYQIKHENILATTNGIANKTDEIITAKKLLVEALEARLDRKLKRIFKILGLKYPPNDIENAYAGIRSNDNELRLNAVEFLDNLLDINLKKIIIPIAESALLDEVVAKTLQRIGMKYERDDEYLVNILNSDDAIVRLRTLTLIGLLNQPKYVAHIVKCQNDPDARVRNLTHKIMKRLGL